MLSLRPEQPTTQVFQFSTQALRNEEGGEFRISRSGNRPRMTLQYDYLLTTDDRIRSFTINQRNALHTLVDVPLWHEEVLIDSINNRAIRGDFSKSDIDIGSDIILSDFPETFEKHEVTAKTDTQITVKDVVDGRFKRNDGVVPVVSVRRLQNGENLYQPVGASNHTFVGTAEVNENIGGYGASSIERLNGRPYLNRRPRAVRGVSKIYEQFPQVFDAGPHSRITIITEQDYSNVVTPVEFKYGNEADKQWFKAFFNELEGAGNSFYHPTYLPDIVPVVIATDRRSMTVSQDTSGTLQFAEDQYLLFKMENGAEHILQVNRIISSPDNPVVELGSAIPAGNVSVVSFIPEVRLSNAETITFRHHLGYGFVNFVITTIIQELAPIFEGKSFGRDWGDSFNRI